jgi:hypothetical protein
MKRLSMTIVQHTRRRLTFRADGFFGFGNALLNLLFIDLRAKTCRHNFSGKDVLVLPESMDPHI